MPAYYTIHLPCRPYIRKYVAAKFGYPVPAYAKSSIGILLMCCMEKRRYTERYFSASFIHQNFTASLSIRVAAFEWVNFGFDFSDEKVIEINQLLKNLFYEHMYDWVQARLPLGRERRYIIADFAREHGIDEDDISLDSLVKKERRLRKAIERRKKKSLEAVGRDEKIFSVKVSPLKETIAVVPEEIFSVKMSPQKAAIPGDLFSGTVPSPN